MAKDENIVEQAINAHKKKAAKNTRAWERHLDKQAKKEKASKPAKAKPQVKKK